MGSRGSDYDCLREAESMRMRWSRRDLRCEVTCAENCTLCADGTLSLYVEESQHEPTHDRHTGWSYPQRDFSLMSLDPGLRWPIVSSWPTVGLFCSIRSGNTMQVNASSTPHPRSSCDCSSGTGRTSYLRLNIRTSLRAQRIDSFHSRSHRYFGKALLSIGLQCFV